MFVSASTSCFADLELDEAIEKLVDLEYTCVEIDVCESGNHFRPSEIAADVETAIDRCMNTRRLNVSAFNLEFDVTGEEHLHQFTACCKLAKATKVVTLNVPSAELGTPFNEEVELLRKMTAIAEAHGVRVAMRSQIGRLSEDPDTVRVLCDNVEGLGLNLELSQYVCGPHSGRDYSSILKYVYNVHLLDASKEGDEVQIGQGIIEYGRLVGQLQKLKYDRAFTTKISPLPEIDFMAEMRKMRLLVESLML